MDFTCLVKFAPLLQVLALLFVGGLAALIAYRQYLTAKDQHQTAHDKLRLDILDRRLEVYTEVRKFVGKVLTQTFPDNEDFGPLWRARDSASFLFGPEVEAFLKRINDTASGLRYTNQAIGFAEGEDRKKVIDQNQEQFTDFITLDSELNGVFRKYMSFSKIQD